MIFENIKQFIDLVDVCPFCKNELRTSLNGNDGKHYGHESAQRKLKSMVFSNEPYDEDEYGYEDLIIQSYFTIVENDELQFYYEFDEHKNKILSVNINTNEIVYGNIERIQNILDKHTMSVMRKCIDRDCLLSGFLYAYQSSKILVGTKTHKVYPLIIDVEMVSVNINSNKFHLISTSDTNSTHLLGERDIITSFPLIQIHKIKDKDALINKIKTYVLFS